MLLNLHWTHWLVLLSALISCFGATAYIRDTLAGITKPNRVTWLMWAVAPLIGTAAALSSGADGWATARVFLAGFIPLLVFLATWKNSQSYWRLSVFDLICGALSAVALLFWLLADSPRTAVLLAATADGFAALPTFLKSWRYPETETGTTYIAGVFGILLVLPSIPVWNIENSSFQIYMLVVNVALVFAVYRRRWIGG